LLEVIRNPQQPRHKELLEWVGGNYDQPGTTWKKKASGPIFGLKNAPELWPPDASADAPDSATQACRKDTNFPKGLPRGWACDGRGCYAGINQTVPNHKVRPSMEPYRPQLPPLCRRTVNCGRCTKKMSGRWGHRPLGRGDGGNSNPKSVWFFWPFYCAREQQDDPQEHTGDYRCMTPESPNNFRLPA
jgi:hypothetical protein